MPSFDLRPATQNDYYFLKNLHRLIMKDYVEELWGWDDEQQEKIFRERFVPSKIQIIEYKNNCAGMLSVEDRGDEIFLANILLMPNYQNQGLGSTIVKELINTARKRKIPLSLSVLRPNRAKLFYETLGFMVVKEDDIRFFMELKCNPT